MSFSSSDDDSQQRFALGLIFALVALVVSVTVGTVVVKRVQAAKTPMVSTAAPAPGAVELDMARVVVEGGVVKFFFATAKADLAEGANEALVDIVKGVGDGKRAVISGYHDATGDAALNAELAKQRALSVLAALKALGVAEDKVELKKPEQTTASGTNAQARRVEVILAQ